MRASVPEVLVESNRLHIPLDWDLVFAVDMAVVAGFAEDTQDVEHTRASVHTAVADNRGRAMARKPDIEVLVVPVADRVSPIFHGVN